MKKALAMLLALVMILGLAACGNKPSGEEASSELNIFMWGDYISEDLISNFEQANGCTINLSYMSDNADSITKLTAGAGSEYDLIMTCDAYMQSLIAGGYLEKLDHAQIPNAVANLNAANSAILKGDYRSAARYLNKAGDTPEAIYTRGALEVYMENNEAAKPYFEEALKQGNTKAEAALTEIAKNRNIYKMNNKQ